MRPFPFLPFCRVATALAVLLAPLAGCRDAPSPTAPLRHLAPAAPRLALILTGTTDLGTMGGDVVTLGDINDFGQIVGSRRDPATLTYDPFLWESGATTLLFSPFLGSSGSARGIDDLGRIVGDIGSWAVVWENGSLTNLGALAAGASAANAINDLGQIVGFSTNAAGKRRAVAWANGVPADLGALGGEESYAADLNGVGQIVGSSRNAADRFRAILWANGTLTDLGTLGGEASSANAINELGQIVGSSETSTPNQFHATRWQNGTATDLGTLGGELSQASDVNELGQVVGTSTDPSGTSLHAVLWMDGSIYELGAPSGSADVRAVAINNLGEVIGFTTDPYRVLRWQVAMRAAIDIVPGDATNAVKSSGAGTLSVAVLGSRWFDAAQIDARTVTLGNEDGSDTPVTRKKSGQPEAVVRDLNRDGYADLVLDFDKRQLVANGDLATSTAGLVLLGTRLDGRRVRGVDRVELQ